MSRSLALAAIAAASTFAMVATSAPASATGLSHLTLPLAKSGDNLVETVRYRRCRAWRFECANRWPGLGWRYQRCLRRHGC